MLLAIMLDAFNYRYLEFDAPFLQGLLDQAFVAEVIPAFGFEPDAAYVAGLSPERSNGGMHYWWDPERSVFRWTRPWSRVAASLPRRAQRVVRRGIQGINLISARSMGRRYGGRPVGIPLDRLHLFDVAQSKLMFQRGFTASPTVFELLEAEGRTWKYLGYPLHRLDAGRLAKRIERMSLGAVDFVFIAMADLDRVGHAHGSRGEAIQRAWARVDAALERIYRHCADQAPQVSLLVFGDHGMADVTELIDLRPIHQSLTVRPWEDYAYFLDSTFARYWTFTDHARQELEAKLAHVKGGTLLTAEDRRRYQCSYDHSRFGDIMLWADGGKMFFPNFYQHVDPVQGMHGYRREVRDNHSGLIARPGHGSPGRRFSTPIEMVDIFATMIDFLNLPRPPDALGQSIRTYSA